MTVKELIEELSKYPQELPIALIVYGHSYSSVDHESSHGSLSLCSAVNAYGRNHVFIMTGEEIAGEKF